MQFVITGCGCSGTKSVAEQLHRLGLDVGHERTYSPSMANAISGRDPRLPTRLRPAEGDGDASWLAEPYVPALLDARVPVIRLVRDPLRVAQSAFADGFLIHRRRERLGPSARWAFAWLPELAEVAGSPLDLAVRWAARWDDRSTAADVPTVRIEDGGDALRTILSHVGRSHLGRDGRADEAARLARGRNTHRADDYPRPGWAEILATRDGDMLAERAEDLGYEVTP